MPRENFAYVVIKTFPNVLGQEQRSLMFATEDSVIAGTECSRLNDLRTTQQRYTEGVLYKIEKIPMLSRRKSRHPFMRGGQRELFNEGAYEKDGNV